jgi:hypothetical protein
LRSDSTAVMQSEYSSPTDKSTPDNHPKDRLGYFTRKPKRISVTISHSVHEILVEESLSQGRSLSNLASSWLEQRAELLRKRAN